LLAQQHKDRELTSRRTCLSAALAAVMLFAGVGAWRAEAEDSGTPWAELAKLLASDGTEEDRLGSSVSISGDTALVGAIFKDDNGTNSGSVYVFVRSDGVWIPEAELLADDGEPFDFFGESVALSGDTALVGAHGGDDHGADSGAAYVFVRSAGVWTQQAKLLASDAGPDDWFGSSVSISGETSLIGAYKREPVGAAYVFVRGGDAWTQQAKLLASDGDCCDAFGRSVSIFEDTALVGAQFDDENGFWSGSAYVFARSGVVWTQQAKLLPNDGAPEDVFGQSVAVEGDTAVVGAVFDDDSGAFSGSAYIFGRNGTAWTQEAKLVPSAGPESVGRSRSPATRPWSAPVTTTAGLDRGRRTSSRGRPAPGRDRRSSCQPMGRAATISAIPSRSRPTPPSSGRLSMTTSALHPARRTSSSEIRSSIRSLPTASSPATRRPGHPRCRRPAFRERPRPVRLRA
jgi:hypothetical protein